MCKIGYAVHYDQEGAQKYGVISGILTNSNGLFFKVDNDFILSSRIVGFFKPLCSIDFSKIKLNSSRPIENTIQPQSLFKLLKVKNEDDALKVLSVAFSFLLYLKEGDCLQTASAIFHKLGPDLIQVEMDLDPNFVRDELMIKRIIKFPL